ncbi:hypothetical protein [Kineosporia sp. NBRC 101731]|uniref:PstS family phosphate ABC transporter substrate-binding protein n=1 Tax=Kineosporia sp. NBRC 101731 TaxID=3032199 RepID=UPI0024A29CB2|nr:hypothetical protein [Kineosporia sp. NBRC 101731]GLY29089.1 phosphate-binding protein [Kineosporia sp. NBRC 101731]
MSAILDELNREFTKLHPDVVFHGVYEGSSPGFPALLSRATPFTALAREVWPAPLEAFRATHGRVPRSIRIGYSGHGPRDNGKTPPSLYVHRDNPLPGLNLASVVRVFADGDPAGDLTRWSQLGLEGRWAGRRIHVYVPDDGLGFVGGFRARFVPRLQLSVRCENVGGRANVVRAVADEPLGIGLTGWCDAGKVSDRVRHLPLSRTADEPFVTASIIDVAAYPLTYPLNLYLWEDDRGIDPIAYAYCELALSDRGQDVVARQTPTEEGYVRLSDGDLEAQRAVLRSWQ